MNLPVAVYIVIAVVALLLFLPMITSISKALFAALIIFIAYKVYQYHTKNKSKDGESN